MIAFLTLIGGAWGRSRCKGLADAPSTYHAHVAKQRDPATVGPRQAGGSHAEDRGSARLSMRISGSLACEGLRESSKARASLLPVAGVRLHAGQGFAGDHRGKSVLKTTVSDKAAHARWITSTASSGAKAECPLALDFTYVATGPALLRRLL